MSTTYRRYQVLLPLRFNDGRPVPRELFFDVFAELREHFGAASFETQRIVGTWMHEGTTYQDETVRVVVDVPDLPEHRAYFVEYKETLKARFRQIDIWLTSSPLEVL